MKELEKKRNKQINIDQDQQILHEQSLYNYFGRGGGGAPLRDREGRILATRKPDPGQVDNSYQHNFNSQPFPNQLTTVQPAVQVNKSPFYLILKE